MNITAINRKYIAKGANEWNVPNDYFEPIFNYVVHGFGPGSFFTALLANDAMTAISHSHPSNTIDSLKCLVGWIRNYVPVDCWGSYEAVDRWLALNDNERRLVLERTGFILTEKREVELVLRDAV